MNPLQDYKFNSTYAFADLITGHVRASIEIFNYDEAKFINSVSKFNKITILHLYIISTALNFYRRDFKKNEDYYFEEDDDSLNNLYDLFRQYLIPIRKINIKKNERPINWFEKNSQKFEELFSIMAEELFYILFMDRGFLLDFNNLISETIQGTVFPQNLITTKRTIRRRNIPEWVKFAVFHRDKGRCVFCNTDLTKLINTFTNNNYDHIVPLDLFGANDPCNIQLSCEHCNKSKSNKPGETSTMYIPWWTRK